MDRFEETLLNELKREQNYINDNCELKKWIVISAAQNNETRLIEILLENEELKNKFFINIKGHLVFNQKLFISYIENKNYFNDSYTKYKNKVGLTIDGKYLHQRNEVALVWPFKDCVLEGGQTREEQKREEIFFNEILAQDEINQLFEPKVLTNWKRYTVDGEQKVSEIKRDEKGNIKENLIIKGNNLLALHSLKKEFEGKVKLIYIDPPYNTGNDSFKYNDNYNHSSWLTFMRNRLEVAKKLLSDDGVIFIHLDYNEIHYCKILMDELFGEENFINEIIWRRKQATSFGNSKFGITNDTIIFYSKSQNYSFYPIFSIDDENTQSYIKERFIYDDGDGRKYMKSPLVNSLFRINLKYEFMGIKPPANGWLYSKEKMEEFYKNGELVIPEDKEARIYRKIFLDSYKGQVIQNIWTDIPIVNPMAKEQTDFSTQKPEKLIERIILSTTKESDIILDYHLGSGTTATVAHKMGRQYIGIEQMEYIQTYAIERLKKVIGKKTKKNGDMFENLEYDESGISKSVDWKGGGDFIYLELKKYNEEFIERIEKAENTNELLIIWEDMKAHSFLNYNIDIKAQDESIEEFKKLTILQQKEHLCELLDKNQLYVNLPSIDDEDFKVSDEDKKLTKEFYGIKK